MYPRKGEDAWGRGVTAALIDRQCRGAVRCCKVQFLSSLIDRQCRGAARRFFRCCATPPSSSRAGGPAALAAATARARLPGGFAATESARSEMPCVVRKQRAVCSSVNAGKDMPISRV